MKHELSTVGDGLAAMSKKGEGKKRAFPLNPYREKAKPKEIKPGVNSTGLSRMRTHARRCGAKAMISAAVEEALRELHGTRGPAPSDEALWAGFAWRFGVGKFLDLCHQAQSEIAQHNPPLPASEMPHVLQGKSWQDMGIAKSTFSDSLKKTEKILRGL